MNTTKLAICTVVGTIFLFLVDYLWFSILGNSSGPEGVMPAMHWMIIGYVLMSLVFCMMYAKGVEPGTATQQGLKFGLMAGLLVHVSTGFMWLAMTEADMFPCFEMDLTALIKDSAFYLVEFALLGVIVAHLSGLSVLIADSLFALF